MTRDQIHRVFGGVVDKNGEQRLKSLLHKVTALTLNHRHLRPELCERKPSPNCDVHDRETAIRSIHSAKYVQVVWQRQAIPGRWFEFVRQVDDAPIQVIRLKQINCLAEDLRQISSIYLIDMQQIFSAGCA